MPRRKRPALGEDYVIDPDGSAQFTRDFLLKRSDCCEHACRYCPYDRGDAPTQAPARKLDEPAIQPAVIFSRV